MRGAVLLAAALLAAPSAGGASQAKWHLFPHWSPDGRRIAFTETDRGPRSAVLAVGHGGKAKVLVRGERFGPISPSPDWSSFAWISGFEPGAYLAIARPGSKPKKVAAASPYGAPAWSPDSSRVVFTTDVGDIVTARGDGTALRRIAHGQWPQWSPRGDLIAYVRVDVVYVVRSDGKQDRKVGRGFELAWGPDGSRIAALYGIHGYESLRVMSVGGRVRDYRVGPPQSAGGAVWSPDGKTIAYAVRQKKTFAVAVLTVATGKSRVLSSSAFPFGISFSPDGSHIAYSGPSRCGAGAAVYTRLSRRS